MHRDKSTRARGRLLTATAGVVVIVGAFLIAAVSLPFGIFAIVVGVAIYLFAPQITSQHSRLQMPWFDAVLKTALIVIGFIVLTVLIPGWAMKTDAVAKLDRVAQDLIGASLWFAGLTLSLWALWFAHRQDRI